MVRVFFPKAHEDVLASKPHDQDAAPAYRVAIGEEQWGEHFQPVLKVQMVYDGVVSGRKAPSFPIGTEDFERVVKAANRLLRQYKGRKK